MVQQWMCIPSVTQVGRASQHMIEYARRDASRLKNTSIIYQTEFERNNVGLCRARPSLLIILYCAPGYTQLASTQKGIITYYINHFD